MKLTWFFVLLFVAVTFIFVRGIIAAVENTRSRDLQFPLEAPDSTWIAPSLYTDFETTGKARAMVMYGEQLISHTSRYFGPHGTISKAANGMNCQNCHLDAGTRPWGNNFGAVYSMYPQYRARSNKVQRIYDRVNDCFERSLNGKAIDTNSYEMQCINAYIKWLGKNVPSHKKPCGSGMPSIAFINRAADLQRGKIIYSNSCQTCHGNNGQGLMNLPGNEFIYPPLWGNQSYNDGAGLFRLSGFAAFVLNNMPYNPVRVEPGLTTADAWDVAAFVNSQPRPHIDQSTDWPDISKKAYDVPFGPYADKFDERQHKYGPYTEIVKQLKSYRIFK